MANKTTTQKIEVKREFMVHFSFTTMHPKSRFIGRKGQVSIESTNMTKEQLEANVEGVKQLCINYIFTEKPEWRIFMIDIQKIVPFTS